jgi:hypothetical protein
MDQRSTYLGARHGGGGGCFQQTGTMGVAALALVSTGAEEEASGRGAGAAASG